MKIGVELRQIVLGPCGGIVPLLQGSLKALFAHHSKHQVDLYCTESNNELFGAGGPNVHTVTLEEEDYWQRLDALAQAHRIDVLFRTYPFEAPLTYPLARQVFLIPDLQHEFFPEFFAPETLAIRRANFDQALRHAGAIATLSEHARETLRNHPATRCKDIFLMSPALPEDLRSHNLKDLTEEERSLLPSRPYFFFPANLWPHKNHRRVLQAFSLFIRETRAEAELILTGHPCGWEELAAECRGLPVRHLGFVRAPMLRVLMAKARALVYFTLFEGFGIPILEAFQAGTPVLCSNTTSHPEVGGDAVLTCDPTAPADMSKLMGRIWSDEPLRALMAARGARRLSLYTYRKSAANLVEACGRVARTASPLWRCLPENWRGDAAEPPRSMLRTLARAVRHPIRALRRLGSLIRPQRGMHAQVHAGTATGSVTCD